MKYLNFVKMTGAGNDFVVIDNRAGVIKNNRSQYARRLSNRRRSVGADGLVLLEKSRKADIRMRIFNPDGSEAEMCGNGVRCVAKFAAGNKMAQRNISIETLAGIIHAEVHGDIVKAKMIDPKNLRLNFKIEVGGKEEILNFINTGVPHAVKVVEAVEGVDVGRLGKEIRTHRHFAPRGTNVDFISIKSGNRIEIRTYERGVEDETLACGTGSTAGALVAAALEGLRSPVLVHTAGGEALSVYFSKKSGKFFNVSLEGKVGQSFEGRVRL